MKREHWIGTGLASAYLLVSIYIIIHAAMCLGVVCKSFVAVPAIPWIAISTDFEMFVKSEPMVLMALIALNAALLYGLGYLTRYLRK